MGATGFGQVIIADSFNVTGSGTGFAVGAGVNTGINPPTTRFTGTAASGMRYILTATTKATTAYSISGNKLRVAAAANPGRFTLSTNGSAPFDFSYALGSRTATALKPVVYDLSISMANSSADTQRFSFALATAEGDATTWDFALQLYRTADSDNFYTIQKRIDAGSSGLTADLNTFITNTLPGTYGSELNLLMRVTDAGAETTTFNSRVQVSLDGGYTWFYDTDSDPDLPSGWRLNGTGRYILWDIAGDAGIVTYDNFSVSPVPVSAVLTSPTTNTPNLGTMPILQAIASNSVPGDVTVTFYGRQSPKPYPGRDFMIAMMPDSQVYVMEGNTPAKLYTQTEWIVTNRVIKNIAYVAHLGDQVQNGDKYGTGSNEAEWQIATNGMYRLENPDRTLLREGIPYGCAVGNHEQEPNGDIDGTTTLYNKYFGISHFSSKSYYGSYYAGAGVNNNSHYDFFSAGGLDFIVVYIEYGRSGSVCDWADAVLTANKTRRAIVVTHNCGPGDLTPGHFSDQAQTIYDALSHNTNLFLMLGGHVDGESSFVATSAAGYKTHVYISDYQFRSGGNGYMRLMTFSPTNSTVSIKTYSPYLNQYETDADSQMSFSYGMQLPTGPGSPGTAYAAIGTNAGVAPGSVTACAWSGRVPITTYDWYVKVTDAAGNSYISPSSRFTTAANSPPVVTNRILTVTGDQQTQVTLTASDSNGDAVTFAINGQPASGLMTGFDPALGLLTYTPARGFRGVDRLTYHASDSAASSSSALVVLNVVAPSDTNANGLPDVWEAAYGISDPNGDNDGDGQSNLAEYRANTNPTNAASVLKIMSAAGQTNGSFTLKWSSAGGTRYRVQSSSGDASGGLPGSFVDLTRDLTNEMDASAFGTASTQAFTESLTRTNRARYYRIRLAP
jgi:hypothetical protein